MNSFHEEVEKIISLFENKNVIVKMTDYIETTFNMDNVHIKYNTDKGYIQITSNTQNQLQINVLLIHLPIIIDKNKVHINIENCLNIDIVEKVV